MRPRQSPTVVPFSLLPTGGADQFAPETGAHDLAARSWSAHAGRYRGVAALLEGARIKNSLRLRPRLSTDPINLAGPPCGAAPKTLEDLRQSLYHQQRGRKMCAALAQQRGISLYTAFKKIPAEVGEPWLMEAEYAQQAVGETLDANFPSEQLWGSTEAVM